MDGRWFHSHRFTPFRVTLHYPAIAGKVLPNTLSGGRGNHCCCLPESMMYKMPAVPTARCSVLILGACTKS